MILGTANWGKRYGLQNYQVPECEIKKIINYAHETGIEYVETSTAYDVKLKYLKGFKVIMKVQHDIPKGDYVIMAHGSEYLKDGIYNVSVDTPWEALQAIAIGRRIIEIPFNIFDRRFDIKNILSKAKIIARSIFLQGLILMDNPPIGKEYIDRLDSIIKPYGISRKEAALLFVYQNPDIDYIVVGVDSVEQLKELVKFTSRELPEELIRELYENFQDVPEEIINPGRWKI